MRGAGPDPDWERLVGLLAQTPVAVLTGAGLSTASGVPAYRDRDGRWRHAPPIRHQDFLASETVRRRYWARSFSGWPRIGHAQPNQGHRALATLEAQGVVRGVITQNVDGLHPRAGSRHLVELHGTIRDVRCLSCHAVTGRDQVQSWLADANPHVDPGTPRVLPDGDAALEDAAYEGFVVPQCPACGGLLKPDVVFFGDNVPRERVERSMALVEAVGALLIVGSSLMVYSGYRFAERAHALGKPVVAINQGVTRADDLLTLKLDADCSAALAAIAAVFTRG